MTADLLSRFVGRWRGTGRGGYPNMASFEYVDELNIIATHKPTMLQYEQRTYKLTPDGGRSPSHIEMGFIRLRDDGAVEWANVQSGGRVEVLVGAISTAEDGSVVVALNQSLLGNDSRMKDSARLFQVSGGVLVYQQDMALAALPDLHLHTSASLQRMPEMMI